MNYIYPKLIYIELTNHCDLRCFMCPNGNNMLTDKGFIDDSTFYKVVDELSEWNRDIPVGLYNMGDSLLHKKLIPYIKYVSKKGLSTFLSTNGYNLNDDLQAQLPESGLNQITFSFEAEDPAEYERIRINSSYERVKRNILGFLEKNNNRIKTTILVIKYGIDKSLDISDEFKNMFKHFDVNFYSYHASDWRGTININILKRDTTGLVPKKGLCHHVNCPVIDWRGNFLHCPCDYNADFPIGSVKTENVIDLFNSNLMNMVRDKMQKGLWNTLKICKNCSAPYCEDTKKRLIENFDKKEIIYKDMRTKMIDDKKFNDN